MNDADARLSRPWLRINRVLRVMLHTGARWARMTLLADLEAFVRDHGLHGGMTGEATPPAWNGYRITVACACGVVFERWVTPDEADADLLRFAMLN